MRYGQQVSAVAGLEFALKKSGMCSLQGAFSCAALFSGVPARQTVQPGEGFSCLLKKPFSVWPCWQNHLPVSEPQGLPE
nr:hypothetical protein [uncultured Ottowia sp.]